HGELGPPTQADSIDRGDRRKRKPRELFEESLSARRAGGRVFRLHLGELLDVRARDEDVRLAADHEERAHPRILREAHEDLGQLDEDLARELVDLLSGKVEREDPHAVGSDVAPERAHARSTTTAPPWPPPMHIVASPNCHSPRRISFRSVVTSRFAEDPTGGPSAMAPPV